MHFVKNLTWYDPWECSRKNLERQDFETWFSILDQGVIRLAFSHANVDQRRVSKGKENKEKKKKGKEKWSDRDIATWKHRTRWNISRATSVICFRSFHSWPSLSAMRKIRLSTRWRPSALTDSKISHVTHAICLQLIAKFLYSRQERLDRKFPRVRISVGSWEIEESFIFYFLFLKNSIFFKSSISFSISIICFDPLNEWNSLKKFLLIFLDFLPFFFCNVF